MARLTPGYYETDTRLIPGRYETAGAGEQSLSPTGIPSAEAFGTIVITTGEVTLGLTGIPSAEAFGTAVIATGEVTLGLTGIPSAEAFGTMVVTRASDVPDVPAAKFGKKFYASETRALMRARTRQEDEEIMVIIKIIGAFLL